LEMATWRAMRQASTRKPASTSRSSTRKEWSSSRATAAPRPWRRCSKTSFRSGARQMPEPARPCLTELARLRALPALVFGPVDLRAFSRRASFWNETDIVMFLYVKDAFVFENGSGPSQRRAAPRGREYRDGVEVA